MQGGQPRVGGSVSSQKEVMMRMSVPAIGIGFSSRLVCMLLAVVAMVSAVLPMGGLAPEPDAVAKKWELSAKFGALRVATVEIDGSPRSFLYLTYTVTNNTPSDILFAPSFELANDEGDLLKSGSGVPGAATKAILARLNQPLLQDQISIVGNLLRGEENSKDGLLVWPLTDLSVNEISIFGAGFSGETKAIIVPDRKTGKESVVNLRKTVSLRYKLSGEMSHIGAGDELPLIEKRWIMR
jgi:hypothetical protein